MTVVSSRESIIDRILRTIPDEVRYSHQRTCVPRVDHEKPVEAREDAQGSLFNDNDGKKLDVGK